MQLVSSIQGRGEKGKVMGVSYPGPRGWGSMQGAPWMTVVPPGSKLALNKPGSFST